MPVEYDPRRPRLPKELAAAVDGVRGQVPFNRWVVRALEAALQDGPAPLPSGVVVIPNGGGKSVAPEPIAPVDPILKDPPSLPAGVSKGTAGVDAPYRCRIESCNLRTTSPAASCGKHGGKVVPNE